MPDNDDINIALIRDVYKHHILSIQERIKKGKQVRLQHLVDVLATFGKEIGYPKYAKRLMRSMHEIVTTDRVNYDLDTLSRELRKGGPRAERAVKRAIKRAGYGNLIDTGDKVKIKLKDGHTGYIDMIDRKGRYVVRTGMRGRPRIIPSERVKKQGSGYIELRKAA